MGESSPPKAADYANDKANTAMLGYDILSRKVAALQKKVDRLNSLVEVLYEEFRLTYRKP